MQFTKTDKNSLGGKLSLCRLLQQNILAALNVNHFCIINESLMYIMDSRYISFLSRERFLLHSIQGLKKMYGFYSISNGFKKVRWKLIWMIVRHFLSQMVGSYISLKRKPLNSENHHHQEDFLEENVYKLNCLRKIIKETYVLLWFFQKIKAGKTTQSWKMRNSNE